MGRYGERPLRRGDGGRPRDVSPTGRRRYAAAIALLFALLFSGGSSLAAEAAPAVTTAPAPRGAAAITSAPVSIGCILPLTGRYAAYGAGALDAILLAAGVFDAVQETPIRLLIEDSRSEPAAAAAAVGKLAAAGVTSILGPLGSQEALEAATEAQRLKVPILTLTQREGITAIGDQVFRNFLTAAAQVRTVVHYAQAGIGLRRFAVLYPDDLYGQEMARLFREEVLSKGGELKALRPYSPDQVDFGAEIRALVGLPSAAAPPDPAMIFPPKPTPGFEALFIPDSAQRVATIVPQLAYHDITGIRLLGTSGWDSPELLTAAPELLQGAIFVNGFFPNSVRPEVNRFVESFYIAYGREPDTMEALVYDAARIAVRLAIAPGGSDRETFRQRLLWVDRYQGVTGKTSFPASRDAEKELFILTVRDGQIIQVK